MVTYHKRRPRLKPLLNKVPPGFMVDASWLKSQGIDPKSIHNYVVYGWLDRVIRGVYRRTLPEGVHENSNTAWQVALLSLQRIMNYAVHLGGESALQLAGFSHYLFLGHEPQAHVYGDVPPWFKRIPTDTKIVVHHRSLFGDDLTGIIDSARDFQHESSEEDLRPAINVWRWPISASSPERAILEALDELPKNASFHYLDMIFEGLVSLRPEQLTTLLSVCRSVKVRRLFFVFADRHQHAWRKYINTSKIDFGSGPRALVEGGKLHPTYKIYVPTDFMSIADSEKDVDA